VKKEKTSDFFMRDETGRRRNIARHVETVPNGVTYEVLDFVNEGLGDYTEV
jgi:signal peptidase I